jgi:hypothetical protein
LIPQANITAWRATVPWADDAQVEQDLVLSRATVELFADDKLNGQIAMRGGTSLHKPLLRPDLSYDAASAIRVVRESLVELLPGDAWRGTPSEKSATKRRRE